MLLVPLSLLAHLFPQYFSQPLLNSKIVLRNTLSTFQSRATSIVLFKILGHFTNHAAIIHASAYPSGLSLCTYLPP